MHAVVLWGNFSYPNSINWKDFYPHFAPILGMLSIFQHKQDVFGGICINCYPSVFLRSWGGCLALPRRSWGPLGLHNTTSYMFKCMYLLMYHRKSSYQLICRRWSSLMNFRNSWRPYTVCLVSIRIKVKMFASTCNLNTSHCRVIHCRHCYEVLSKFGPRYAVSSKHLFTRDTYLKFT